MIRILSVLLLLAGVAWCRSLEAPVEELPGEREEFPFRIIPRRAFDGCKPDPNEGFRNNVFYQCQNPDKANQAALSISPAGSKHGMCHDPHKPGFYAHYHPAAHTEVDGLNYHFHWGSKDYGLCPYVPNPNYKGKNPRGAPKQG